MKTERKKFFVACAALREKLAATKIQAIVRMKLTQEETSALFLGRREEAGAKMVQRAVRMRFQRDSYNRLKEKAVPATAVINRFWTLLSGESGVRFKSTVARLLNERRTFYERMDALVAKYSDPPKETGGGAGGSGGGGGGKKETRKASKIWSWRCNRRF